MITSLLAQHDSETPVVLCKSNPRNVAKHAAACEEARKAYLREVYGFQPSKGSEIGIIVSAFADGSVIAIDIRFVSWGAKWLMACSSCRSTSSRRTENP